MSRIIHHCKCGAEIIGDMGLCGKCAGEEPYLSDADASALIENFAKTRGAKGFRMDEVEGILTEARKVRIENAMLNSVICGDIKCDWDGKDMLFAMAENLKKPAQ